MQNDGELGDLLLLNMTLWINNPNESSPWFHIRALHAHSIDVMRFFGGDVARVQCFMHASGERKCLSNLSMNLQFTSGALGHLTGSYDASGHHPIERCEVVGTKGRGVIENVYERLDFFPREDPAVRSWHNGIMGGMGSFNDTFKNRIGSFVDEVSAGELQTATGKEGLAAQEVIEAAIRFLSEQQRRRRATGLKREDRRFERGDLTQMYVLGSASTCSVVFFPLSSRISLLTMNYEYRIDRFRHTARRPLGLLRLQSQNWARHFAVSGFDGRTRCVV